MTKEEETQHNYHFSGPNSGPENEPLQDKTADFFSRSQRRNQGDNQGNVPPNMKRAHKAPLPSPHRWTIPIITVGLNIIWWQQPIIYQQAWQNAQNWQIWSLIAYSCFSALALAFLIQNRFSRSDWRSWAALAASMVVLFNSQLRSRFEVLALLLLLVCFLIILPIPAFQLKNALGVIGLSLLLTFSVPICIAYLAHNYVDGTFLKQSWLLAFAFAFYLAPLFLPNMRGRQLEFVAGFVFLIALFVSQGLTLPALIAGAIAGGAFIFSFVRPLTYQLQPLVAMGALVITTVLFYH
ncbi:hypothetical protein [Fructobacillus ficulneus]|uniref:hypothetical protein n=1 Tax=Fructobacillus ficulneus TaxID=157463 RepID=UPI0007820105|nr:hypothetical protein [Fructobacillus ficulneus]